MLSFMSTPNETNAIVPAPQGNRYEDAIWDVFFEIWLFLADRNCQRARDIFLRQFREHETFDEARVPSVRQIQYRAKNENWDVRANSLIAKTAQHIDKTQLARLWVMTDKAIDLADRIISGEFYDGKAATLAIMADMVKEMLKLRGLGTAGVLGAPMVTVEVTNTGDAVTQMTADQKAEFFRNATLKEKQIKKLTGKKS